MGSIRYVVENGLCNGCCECISACSENNIFMMLDRRTGGPVPYVADNCKNCGACLKVCEQSDTSPITASRGKTAAVS